jgi:restriction system protein
MSEMPTWDGFMTPVLRVLEDGATRKARDVHQLAADRAGLTVEQRSEVLDSGQLRFRNRVGWAVSSLTRAGALFRPQRGSYVITDFGHQLLTDHPGGLTEGDLKQIPAWREHVPAPRNTHAAQSRTPLEQGDTALDPLEQIDAGVRRLHADVAAQLLDRLREANPDFLEQSVLDVLVAMGYGGVEQRARRIGGSGDGGVDGVIDQDPLGLARIYVQAKRYATDNVVGRPQIQGFVGALHGQQANQGIFITTSRFSDDAADYARSINASVVLIDGDRLASLMIAHGVGVQSVQTYTVVEVDEDYFE